MEHEDWTLVHMTAVLTKQKSIIDALVEALTKIESEACKGLDLGETRDSLIDIKFRSRAAIRTSSAQLQPHELKPAVNEK